MSIARITPRDPLLHNLSCFLRLSEADVNAIADLTKTRRRFPPRTEIAAEGDRPCPAFVVLDGMVCRSRTLSDGRRQILSFHVPGDVCEFDGIMLKRMDHTIATVAPTWLSIVTRERLLATLARHPRIRAALRWTALQGEAIQREHVVALGRRNAHERVAYLLCEMAWRNGAMGGGETVRLPITQTDIADALGLTPIHVNRVLQEFRKDRLIEFAHYRLTLLDMERLMEIAELSPDYLHRDGAPPEIERECADEEAI